MGNISLTRTLTSYGVQVWQKILETVQGGFTLDNAAIADGTIIPSGTPMSYDEATRKATPLKTAKVYEAAAVGDAIFQSSATGATAGAAKVTANGLLYEDTTSAAATDVSVVVRGTIYARRSPAVPPDFAVQTIIFSQSF
jgi:hypothetical protein